MPLAMDQAVEVLKEWEMERRRRGRYIDDHEVCITGIWSAIATADDATSDERVEEILKIVTAQSDILALILEALTPEGCGHENWEEKTTSGAPHRTYYCAEPGCTEQKTEPWG